MHSSFSKEAPRNADELPQSGSLAGFYGSAGEFLA